MAIATSTRMSAVIRRMSPSFPGVCLRRAPSKEPLTAASRLANRSLTGEKQAVKYECFGAAFLSAPKLEIVVRIIFGKSLDSNHACHASICEARVFP